MKKQNERPQQPSYNVEFGMEFGDINAGKMYEFPIAGKHQKKKAKKENS